MSKFLLALVCVMLCAEAHGGVQEIIIEDDSGPWLLAAAVVTAMGACWAAWKRW